ELRNPMGVINGYAGFLARRLGGDAQSKDAVDSIISEIKVMDEIIREFMSFAQPTELNITEVDINGVADEAVRALPAETGRERPEFHPAEGLPRIQGDFVLLRQVFVNLVKNAVEATHGGGSVSISTSSVDGGQELRGLPHGSYVRVEVSDTGDGIDEQNLNKIFMPFFTTKAHGTGLGLALVQKILVYHGGRAFVKSKKGKGTTFNIYLPVRSRAREA
ncbi:MAG TPA: ATP-binding protein, partial [Nitrospirota bacterium]